MRVLEESTDGVVDDRWPDAMIPPTESREDRVGKGMYVPEHMAKFVKRGNEVGERSTKEHIARRLRRTIPLHTGFNATAEDDPGIKGDRKLAE
ncbi:hypothetical protein B2J93_3401 [Marssonina coronariae]|uniref:Uncharacterized protein n=1 Tax=Diplocarpon coronariae TaxID=2795749 RepID=A0A218ZA42_9HELO|nr:hypothetical protein B2J93_3401 [Marssonina coronariae]